MPDTVVTSNCGVQVRNIRRFPTPTTEYPTGYSYEFEALCGDEWVKFGPHVFGNWSVASHIDTSRAPCVFPRSENEEELLGPDRDAVYVGWYELAKLEQESR